MAIDVPSGAMATAPTPAPGDPRLRRLSLNQKTIDRATVPEAVDACVRAGIPAIGLWREHVAATGLARTARIVAEAGLRVSSLCRGGFLTQPEGPERAAALDDNRRAIDEAAALSSPCLVLVVGGLPPGSRDLPAARARVADALAHLAPYAGERGVRLALEPLHPMYCADRAVLSTLGQSLDIAEQFPPQQVGVVVDAFHLWWDPRVHEEIARAGARIASFQVGDWITPLPHDDVLMARGMMGDGHIDLASLRASVATAGYADDIEVEIFNAAVWNADYDDVVATTVRRYLQHVWAPDTDTTHPQGATP